MSASILLVVYGDDLYGYAFDALDSLCEDFIACRNDDYQGGCHVRVGVKIGPRSRWLDTDVRIGES